MLQLLVVGASRQAVAEKLHLSVRAVDLRLAVIRRVLATSQRFCLGVRAVRHDWVDRHYPISHALARRRGGRWEEPIPRQRDIMWMLAAGESVDGVAEMFGMCVRTVRRDLAQLAAANGAAILVHSGALAEALGWLSDSNGMF